MDFSDLERVISKAELSLDSLSFLLKLTTALVVVGLAIEYFPLIRKMLRHWRDKEVILELLGGIIVTLAIAGELAVQFKASRVETRLREANHRYVALLSAEEAEAKKQAAEIMKATAWRQFTRDQEKKILQELAKNPGAVTLAWVANDSESLALAIQFSKFLEQAKWSVSSSAKTFDGAIAWGITIPNGTPAAQSSMQALRGALASAGIPFSTNNLPPESESYSRPAGPAFAIILFGSKHPTYAQPPN